MKIQRNSKGQFIKGHISWHKNLKLPYIPHFAMRGHIPWNKRLKGLKTGTPKGTKFSEEHCKNISKAQIGKVVLEKTKKKISKTLKGRKASEKTRKKMSEALKGEKHYNWKDGITPINKKIRKGIDFRLWRESIFFRDNWTCQKCKIKGKKIHPHHIYNFSQYPKLRFVVSNGITLCEKCHIKFHKIYGKKNNTKEQLNEFLLKN